MKKTPFCTIDARELPAPEPFVKTMEALETLPAGEFLRLILPREPFPLYSHLIERGVSFSKKFTFDGEFAGCWLIDIHAPPAL